MSDDQEVEEVLRLAVRIIARRENDGLRTREGQDFLYRARKVLLEPRRRATENEMAQMIVDRPPA